MNDINKMPPVCAYCPYWEVCKPPYICPDIGDEKPKRTDKHTETHACDLISREAALEALDEINAEIEDGDGFDYEKWRAHFCEMPSAQPEPLTGKEKMIFLAAMAKEENICKQIDDEYRDCELYEDSLVRACQEIERKVRGALWT